MARYSVEFTFLVAHYVHEDIEAETEADAIAEAKRRLAEDAIDWARQKEDYDSSRETEITGMWLGDAYRGPEIDLKAKG